MLITDWLRTAVAGVTVDGREIKEQTIEEVSSSYDPETYNARIWPEHIRGITPDGMFKALGDVVQAKAERIKGGDLAGRLALYLRIAPHQDLIAMVRNGQKVHTSVEIQPDFAGTGKAYLVGLGVTDSPASLGTGIMKFSTAQRHENLFSTPQESPINLPSDADMNPEQFRQLINEAIKPLTDRIDRLENHYSHVTGAQNKIIEMLTPAVGNRRQPGDREPHNGGDSEPRRNIY